MFSLLLLLVSLLSYCYKYNYHNIITTFIIITIAVLIAIISIVVISNYHYYYYHYISNVTVISRPLTDTHINQLLFSFIHFFFFRFNFFLYFFLWLSDNYSHLVFRWDEDQLTMYWIVQQYISVIWEKTSNYGTIYTFFFFFSSSKM